MSSTDFTKFAGLAEKFNGISNVVSQETAANVPLYARYERAYSRVQKALLDFKVDPGNASKSKSFFNAVDAHQTAIELLLLQTQQLFERAIDAGVDLSALNKQFDKLDSNAF